MACCTRRFSFVEGIKGGGGTRVYYTSQDGYDTHYTVAGGEPIDGMNKMEMTLL